MSSMPGSSTFLLKMYALSPLHPGLGSEEGIVDLPVQKDQFGFPCIYASSIKGCIKSTLYSSESTKTLATSLFGDDDKKTPGTLVIQDAYLLVVPARSLRGVVIGVSCPFLIERYLYIKENFLGRNIVNSSVGIEEIREKLTDANFLFIDDEDRLSRYMLKNKIIVNEIALEKMDLKNIKIDFLKNILNDFIGMRMRLVPYRDVILVSDDVFKLLLKRSMIIYTRVKLDHDTKTVGGGGPFTEEYTPQGSIFYSMAILRPMLNRESAYRIKEEDILTHLSGVYFIGGDETIGRGALKIVVEKV